MREIPLTQGFVAVVDDCDVDLAEFGWYAAVRKGGARVYAQRKEGPDKVVLLHRVILARKLGRAIPRGMETDHHDGDGLNNRRHNLRLATHSQNQGNRKKRKEATSRYHGVYWQKEKGKWHAQIRQGGKKVYLGLFSAEEDAARAYNEAAINTFGPFASLNDI
jgi:hypothetical protein